MTKKTALEKANEKFEKQKKKSGSTDEIQAEQQSGNKQKEAFRKNMGCGG